MTDPDTQSSFIDTLKKQLSEIIETEDVGVRKIKLSYLWNTLEKQIQQFYKNEDFVHKENAVLRKDVEDLKEKLKEAKEFENKESYLQKLKYIQSSFYDLQAHLEYLEIIKDMSKDLSKFIKNAEKKKIRKDKKK